MPKDKGEMPLDRKNLTFEQAEGADPLPAQLHLKQISPELRSTLWEAFFESLKSHVYTPPYESPILVNPWKNILYRHHVERAHQMADEFDNGARHLIDVVKQIFVRGDYLQLFGFVQWVLRQNPTPPGLASSVERVLVKSRAAYMLVGGDTISPIPSEADQSAIRKAFAEVSTSEFGGSRAHLRAAAGNLTDGKYADSIRESIHAVEAVARVLDPTAKVLGSALKQLEKKIRLHGALRAGFDSLYGFTSDEKGIRHTLLDEPVAPVDETDALYMYGSCAAFVTYLIGKARSAGLLAAKN